MKALAATQTASSPSSTTGSNFLLQRKCACGGPAGVSCTCEECADKQLLKQPLQAKLVVGSPDDPLEREADRVAEEVMHMPDPSPQGLPSRASAKPRVQRRVAGISSGTFAAPPEVHHALSAPGCPLDTATRAFFEPRFGHDFSRVRVHTDSAAAASAQAIQARAYTVGEHIVIGAERHLSGMQARHQLLAHELTHVVQQAGLHTAPAMVRRLSAEAFKERLGRTPEQEEVVTRLFAHPTFTKLWDWLGRCTGEPKDHGPIKLRVGRSFSDGLQTFGGFNQTRGILTINPMNRAAHRNPLELVDTIVHELVHAVSWAIRTGKCPGQKAPMEQVEDLVHEDDRHRFMAEQSGYARTQRLSLGDELMHLERLGPSASDPCNFFLDIEATPQAAVVEITRDIKEDTGIGAPTRTAVNQILRDELRQARELGNRDADAILAAAPTVRLFMGCLNAECARRRPRKRGIFHCFDMVLEQQGRALRTPSSESVAEQEMAA